MYRTFALLLVLIASPALGMSCDQMAVYAGSAAVDRDHGVPYDKRMKMADEMPVPYQQKQILRALTAFTYRMPRPPEHIMIAIKRGCTSYAHA